jgi:hypothetical protein
MMANSSGWLGAQRPERRGYSAVLPIGLFNQRCGVPERRHIVKDAIIALGYIGGMTIVFVIGLTLLISPRHFFLLQDRLAKTGFWSRPSQSWDAGAGLQWRALGLFLTLLSLLMVLGPILRDRARR